MQKKLLRERQDFIPKQCANREALFFAAYLCQYNILILFMLLPTKIRILVVLDEYIVSSVDFAGHLARQY